MQVRDDIGTPRLLMITAGAIVVDAWLGIDPSAGPGKRWSEQQLDEVIDAGVRALFTRGADWVKRNYVERPSCERNAIAALRNRAATPEALLRLRGISSRECS